MAIDFSVVGSCSVGCNERWRGRRRGPTLLFWWGETVWSRCLVTHVEFKDMWNIGVIYLFIHYSQRPWKPRFSAISRMLDGESKKLVSQLQLWLFFKRSVWVLFVVLDTESLLILFYFFAYVSNWSKHTEQSKWRLMPSFLTLKLMLKIPKQSSLVAYSV